MATGAPVDVVIPVHDAVDHTRRCLASVYEWIAPSVGRVVIFDDASSDETARMLEALRYPRLEVHRTDRNLGFGAAVNAAVAKTTAAQVLVLNSDVLARCDFLAPLSRGLDSDPRLAAVTPVRGGSGRGEVAAYAAPGGVVPAFTIRGFAFLMRRHAFEEAGGFDRAFGRGYFEDTDLSRRWVSAGWRLGVVPESVLDHEGHGSFSKVEGVASLMDRNRRLYQDRHPTSRTRLLVIDAGGTRSDRASLEHALEVPLRGGASVEWRSKAPASELPAIEIRVRPYGGSRMLVRLVRAREREPRRYSDLWMLGTGFVSELLAAVAGLLRIRVRRFPTESA